ncbi:zinc-binding alcohol dehydrogenase family protein [Vitiosangium sp. GDMCC 1.1324]|uniref:quinone oxidoreductase family protein n=1 Tax=Vitiosangium sp. (strain GDMCC 1.1324) TaxID=2138576 RepID=UPI000D339437|nr:zinc-binding alcohol dehydrogenase family protein [Vitiosangium sp. GDMCC 1.1324]PTL77752.1 alcohol dehydrogenase [Vitiosangium sp. GDMCC 1.1324]
MHAAVVRRYGEPPRHETFQDPVASEGEQLVRVSAAALSPLVKSIAAGKHYSSKGVLPLVPGVDGVGRLADGSRVYFAFPRFPYGSMAEKTVVASGLWAPVPDQVDDVTAAAIANPGMSSWAALRERAHLQPGESVLVNGATGTAGRLAIQIARHMGARRVVVTGRNPEVLKQLGALGADAVISLEQPEDALAARYEEEFSTHGVDVVLDYLWGAPAEKLLRAIRVAAHRRPQLRVRFVQIGSIAGETLPFPASALRSSQLELVGSGIGSVSNERLVQVVGELLSAVVPAGLSVQAEAVPLSSVSEVWEGAHSDRVVFTM